MEATTMALASWVRNWKRSIEYRWQRQQSLRRKHVDRRRAVRPVLESLEGRWLLSTYVVISTADDGSQGTLRDAINQANAAGSTITEIDFNIATVGSSQSINLTSQLPTLTASGIFINGLSQGGSGSTTQLITLDGSNAASGSDGLLLQGTNCTVSGLIIENFSKNGIEVAGSNNTIGGTAAGAGDIISGNAGDGVLIDSNVSGVQVLGNLIGTNTAGDAAMANGDGIVIDGDSNTVGGTVPRAHNLISGNNGDGIHLNGSGNQVLGNYIGTNAAGNAALSNANGVEIDGSGNTLGGSGFGAGNLISGISSQGVLINGSGNQVLGNYIGTNAAGNAILANGNGIEVFSSSNTIGGTSSGAGNLISGNGNGILLSSGGDSNLLLGNSIGINAAGNAALANGSGIEIDSSNNTIGGTSSGAGNLISGNGNGIYATSGGSGNQVLGNSIGINAAGNAALGNGSGIEIDGSGNTVGGTTSGAANLISGNSIEGVFINGSGNQVLGNSIGTNATANAAVANRIGIVIGSSSNTIGGTASGTSNLISGNSLDGVLINGSGNQVLGNSIGTNAAGNAALANGTGIMINSSSNTIGGTTTGAGNLISGNSGDGVVISIGDGNQVLGNSIGTNPAGTAALANQIGVYLLSGSGNTIGGTTSGARNLISGNSKAGVLIDLLGINAQVMGNYIGTDVTGDLALANSVGIEVAGSSNTIGGTATGAGNLIWGNSGDGVLLDSASSDNQVLGNSIGTNASDIALGNGGYGVNISGSNNTIGGSVASAANIIADNTQGGVLVSAGGSNSITGGGVTGSGNTIRLNSIYANGSNSAGPGITLGKDANNNLAAPNLVSAYLVGTTLTVNSSFAPPTANVSYVLDVYANLIGDAEGKVFLGSLTVTPTSTATQSFSFTTTTTVTGSNPLITVVLTDASGDTSSFSNGMIVSHTPPVSPPQFFPVPSGPRQTSLPPVLNMPPLLALINFFLGGIETINANGTETLTDSLFGMPLLVSTFDSSGQLMNVKFLGIDATFLFG
jgi:titin